MKKLIALSVVTVLVNALYASDATVNTELETVQKEIGELKKELKSLKKKQQRMNSKLSEVKAHDAHDNIKFGVDFRNAIDVLEYKDHINNLEASNDSLLSSRLYLNMGASPMDGLIFKGQLAIYSTWGSHLYVDDAPLKDWSASSKADDTVMRVKEAYVVYSDTMGEQPYSVSVGRRPSSNGFLANYRENEPSPGSPLAHITNMEVNAVMLMLNWSRFLEGAYTKFVYGRAHTGKIENVYGTGSTPWGPYATINDASEDDNVDFFVMPGDAYYDGKYQVMYQWAHIFNTKGTALNDAGSDDNVIKAASGTADLFSLGLKVDGIGDGISEFLDNSIVFGSLAYSNYDAKDGYSLLGSEDGGSKSGQSFWIGAIFPDMMTEKGKIGLEYNHGSKYWTPMTWAEDSAIGSKIAVRGDAYEAYWNFNLFGVEYLPSQVRYTYAQHDYTPNVNCAGWVASQPVDITASDLRFFVAYRY